MPFTQEIGKIMAHTVVCVVDRRGRIIWSSDDPLDRKERAGVVIMDMLPEEDRAKLSATLHRCIVENTVSSFVTVAPRSPALPDGPNLKWRATFLPYESDGVAAAISVSALVPSNYEDINDDDKNVLRLLCEDNTLKEIAGIMERSESGIDAKVKGLKEKLGVKNLAGMVAAALMQHVI